jgi:hypothetical protein
MAVAVACGAVMACGRSPARPSPTPSGAAAEARVIARVTVSLPAGHGASLTSGEHIRLTATATYLDGGTTDCTGSAAWTSSDPHVAQFTATPGELAAAAGGTVDVSARCGATVTGTLTLTVGRGVRIGGLEGYPYFITGDVTEFLTATIVAAGGQADADCTATAVWASSNRQTLEFDALYHNRMHVWTDGKDGDVTLTATCGDATGQLTVHVDHYALGGIVRGSDGQPIAGAHVDGTQSGADGSFSEKLFLVSPTLKVSQPGFETVRRPFTWDRQPAMTTDVTLTALPEVFLDRGGTLCQRPPDDPLYAATCVPAGAVNRTDTYSFQVPHAGSLRLMTHWSSPPGGSEIDNYLDTALRCDGALVWAGEVSDGRGGGFIKTADPGCHYVLTLTNITTALVLPYRFTLNMQ